MRVVGEEEREGVKGGSRESTHSLTDDVLLLSRELPFIELLEYVSSFGSVCIGGRGGGSTACWQGKDMVIGASQSNRASRAIRQRDGIGELHMHLTRCILLDS